MTGRPEFNGTSILDVTDPANPKYLTHIPGLEGNYEEGGAQMVRVCDGAHAAEGRSGQDLHAARVRRKGARDLGRDRSGQSRAARAARQAAATRTRTGGSATPASPTSSPACPGWRMRRMTQVYDLSDPAKPVHIRDFGLAGPGAGRDRHGADRAARRDLDRPAGQPRLFRLRHQQGRRAADRRPREAAERSEGADAGQSARPGDRRIADVAAGRRAHGVSARQDARFRSSPTTRPAPSATS